MEPTAPAPGQTAHQLSQEVPRTLVGFFSRPALRHELDPAGDIIFELQNVPNGLALDLNPENLSGMTSPQNQGSATSASTKAAGEEPGSRKPQPQSGSHRPVQVRASSRHLALSSPYFSRLLNGGFKEASQFKSQGFLSIPVKDWEALPFLMLMVILHGKTRKVPRKVSLERLIEMAFLVDFYECLEAVEVFSEMWINDLAQEPCLSNRDNAHPWLFISWVFHRGDIFGKLTQEIQEISTGRIEGAGFPIPAVVLGVSQEFLPLFILNVILREAG